MIRIITAVASALFLLNPAWAQDKDKPTAQQERMKSCNAQASKKDLNGDERKAFMSKCLSADSAKKKDDEQLTAQQQKMKTCNAQASKKELKGDERKAFLSTCLKA
jgi:psiF repeat